MANEQAKIAPNVLSFIIYAVISATIVGGVGIVVSVNWSRSDEPTSTAHHVWVDKSEDLQDGEHADRFSQFSVNRIKEMIATLERSLGRETQLNKGRWPNVISFWAGAVQKAGILRFPCTEQFRTLPSRSKEGIHDYVQVVFPIMPVSRFGNHDIHLDYIFDDLCLFLGQNMNLAENIVHELFLDAVSMLEFWEFKIEYREEGTFPNLNIIILKIEVPPANGQNFNNHNNQRMSRLLQSLDIFGCEVFANMIRQELKVRYPGHSSLGYWESTEECHRLFQAPLMQFRPGS
jgi:hypothetical protein